MPITFICGGAGAGKTTKIYEGVLGIAEKEPDRSVLLIVPEQFTMQTQMDMVKKHPNCGIMNIEVLSFGRLAFRVFEEIGRVMSETLEDTGKSMVLKKIVTKKQNELTYFKDMSNKFGFMDRLKTLISEFHQYEVGMEDLKKWEDSDDFTPILKEKLHDLSIIYEGFHDYIKEQYITTEETLDFLKESLPKSQLLKDAILVFDGFYGFTPQQYSIMKILMTMTQHMIYSLTIDNREDLMRPLDETHIFYSSKETFDKICKLAGEQGIHINRPQVVGEKNSVQNYLDLNHLKSNIFRYPYKVWTGDIEHMKVIASVNPLKEAEYVCREVYHLIKEQGYNYRDIAILTGDIEGYKQPLERLFQLYDLPYFIDSKREIYANPLIEVIRSIMDIYVHQFSYESVMRLLKTGFIALPSPQHLDTLENFVLEKGIRGKGVWHKENWFENKKQLKEEEEARNHRIEEARHIFISQLSAFTELVSKGNKTVRDMTMGLYDLLIALKCPQTIREMQVDFEKRGEHNIANEYSQIWKTVMDLMDQVVAVLGQEIMSIKDYAGLIEAGLEQCKIGLVPPSLDQIIVGDLERTRLHSIKALFAMGFNDGLIPSVSAEKGLFTEEDRERINAGEKGIAKSKKAKMNEEYFLVYNGLSKPTEKLYLSYSLASMEGKPLGESFILKQIHKIMPELDVYFDDPKVMDEHDITMPKPTLFKYIQERQKDKTLSATWQQVEKWYKEDNKWTMTFEKISEGFNHHNQVEDLSEEVVSQLYGQILHGSVSKLEKFATCPFSYFVRYGLKAEERKLGEIKPPDVGVFFHLVLEIFARKLKQKGLSWANIDEDTRLVILEDCIEEATPLLQYTSFLESSRSNYFRYRLKKITKKAVSTLQEHLQHGEFVPRDFELDFGQKGKLPAIQFELDSGKEMQLTGKIDRVDLLDEGDHYYAKIIDYKSGSEKFDVVAIYNGLQLQLIVYLDALTGLGDKYFDKPIKPAGVFYFKVDDPMIQANSSISKEVLQEKLFGEMKMSGLVLSDAKIIEKMDRDIATNSSVIPVKMNKNGSFSKTSSVADEAGFEMLQSYARKKTKELGEEILAGNVKIEPYKKTNETGCDYCQYKAICQFDMKFEGNEYKYLDDVKKDFWDIIKKELDA